MIIYISKKIHDFSEKDIFIEFFKYVSCFLAKVFIRTHLIAGNSSPSWLVVYLVCVWLSDAEFSNVPAAASFI